MKVSTSVLTALLAQGAIVISAIIGARIPPPNENKTSHLSPTTNHIPGPPTPHGHGDGALRFEALKHDAANLNITIAKIASSPDGDDDDHHQSERYPGLWFTKYIWYRDPQNLCSFEDDTHNFTASSAANVDNCEFLYRFFDGTTGAWEVSEWEGGYNHDQDWIVSYIDCKFWVRRKDGLKTEVLFGNIDMRDRLRYALDNYVVDYGTTIGKRVGAIGRGNCREPEEADIEWMIYS